MDTPTLDRGLPQFVNYSKPFFQEIRGLKISPKMYDYDTKHLPQMPIFYRNILQFFKELKIMYGYDQGSDLVLFNNKEILVDNKSVYLSNWIEKGVISIKDLLNDH